MRLSCTVSTIARYWMKISNFSYPMYLTPPQRGSLRFVSLTALKFKKTRIMGLSSGRDKSLLITSALLIHDRSVTEKKISNRHYVRCVGAHPPFGPLSRRGLNPIKPVYDPDQPDGLLSLKASAFNQLGQYTTSPQSWSQGLLLRRTRRFLP